MSEKENPMHPELEQALRAYEVEVRDGTERSQQFALQALRAVRRRLATASEQGSEEAESAEAAAS